MKKKIDVKQLELGMYVAELDRSWLESPFLFQGFKLANEKDLKTLVDLCEFVYVDVDKSDFRDFEARRRFIEGSGQDEATTKVNLKLRPPKTFEDEIEEARQVHQDAEGYIAKVFENLRLGEPLQVEEAKVIVSEMINSIMRNPDALLLLSNLKAYDEGAVTHSMNVCTMALTFGRFLGLDKNQMHELGFAALLHDIGETKVPKHILEKRFGLSPEEVQQMQSHVELGAEILRQQKEIPASAIDVAYSHHERINGSGYPRKLQGDAISFFAKIIAILDVYDRLTHAAKHNRYVTSTNALKNMYDYRGRFFDSELIEKFIQCLGIYPVGSVVELNSGEVGVVISISPENHLLPKLMLVRDKQKKPIYPPTILNLMHYKGEGGSRYSIAKVLQPNAYGIDLKKYMLREFSFSA